MAKENEQFARIVTGHAPPEATAEPTTFAKILDGIKDAGGAVWDGAARHAEHGSAELAAALFSDGNSFVAYGWSNSAQEQAGPDLPAAANVLPEKHQENEGREM